MKNEVLIGFGKLSIELTDDDGTSIAKLYKRSSKARSLLQSIQKSELGQHYKLRVRDILLLISLWKRHMRDESVYVSSVDILRDVYGEKCNPFLYFIRSYKILLYSQNIILCQIDWKWNGKAVNDKMVKGEVLGSHFFCMFSEFQANQEL